MIKKEYEDPKNIEYYPFLFLSTYMLTIKTMRVKRQQIADIEHKTVDRMLRTRIAVSDMESMDPVMSKMTPKLVVWAQTQVDAALFTSRVRRQPASDQDWTSSSQKTQ